jgi:hypothetical protein
MYIKYADGLDISSTLSLLEPKHFVELQAPAEQIIAVPATDRHFPLLEKLFQDAELSYTDGSVFPVLCQDGLQDEVYEWCIQMLSAPLSVSFGWVRIPPNSDDWKLYREWQERPSDKHLGNNEHWFRPPQDGQLDVQFFVFANAVDAVNFRLRWF